MNLPNSLTMARLIVIPVFLLVVSMEFHYADYYAAGLFLIAALTDILDGYFARKENEVTLLGKFLDPIADKILITAALISLVEMGRLPGWIAVLIISREIAVTGLRAIAAAEGTMLTPSRLGKIKTVTQVIAIISLYLGDFPFNIIHFPFGYIALTFAIIFTIWSGMDYFLNFNFSVYKK